MRRILAGLILLVVAGCGTTTARVDLTPAPNSCQVSEVRPTWLSTQSVAVCWDDQGHALGMAGAPGMPAMNVPLSLIQSGATVAGPAAGALIIRRAIQGISLSTDVTVTPVVGPTP